MKQLFRITFAAMLASLALASCNREQVAPGDDSGDLASITYKVSASTQVTKAFGDGASATNLTVQVFRQDAGPVWTKTNAVATITPGASKSWTVELKLAKSYTYRVAFWAQSSGVPAGAFDIDDLNAVAVDYSKFVVNNDAMDVFCNYEEVTVTGAASKNIILTRPLAQLNLIATDWSHFVNSAPASAVTSMQTAVTINGAPSLLNVITGETSGSENMAIPASAILAPDGTPESHQLAVAYILAPKAKALTDATIVVSNDNSSALSTIAVSNLPYQANWRTNITGQLLTGTLDYTITINPEFDDERVKQIAPSFASVADLNAYFASWGTDADNGDVNPEEVELTAVGAGGTVIKLPATNENIRLSMPFSYDGTITIQYADGASSDAQRPANLSLYVTSLSKLVADITSTHFTLLAGSNIPDQADVHTSPGTFVMEEGAHVGTLKIQQGNAQIAGEVAAIEVVEGATADGASEPVQVSLAPSAAVETVTLNAKSDVVVEQPQGNIDAGATENKVTVVVNAEGSTATAQNGGDIYVVANADCEVNANGSDGEGNASTVVVTTESDESINVTANSSDDGEIVIDNNDNLDVEGETEDGKPAVYVKYVSGDPQASAANLRNAVNSAADGSVIYIPEGTYRFTASDYDRIYINKDKKVKELSFLGLGNGPVLEHLGTQWGKTRVFYMYANYGSETEPTVINMKNLVFTQPNLGTGYDPAIFVRGLNSYSSSADFTLNTENVVCPISIIDNNYFEGDKITFNIKNSSFGKLVVDASPFGSNGLNTYSNVNYDETSSVNLAFQEGIRSGGINNILINGKHISRVALGNSATENAANLRAAIDAAEEGTIIFLPEASYEVVGQSDRIYVNHTSQSQKNNLTFIGEGKGAYVYGSASTRPNARTFYVYFNNTTQQQTVNLGFENITFDQPNFSGADCGVWFRGTDYNKGYGASEVNIQLRRVSCNQLLIDNNYVEGDVCNLNLVGSNIPRLVVDASPMAYQVNTYSNVTYDAATTVNIEFQSNSALEHITVNGVVPSSRDTISHVAE